jgi:hypothetical protein
LKQTCAADGSGGMTVTRIVLAAMTVSILVPSLMLLLSVAMAPAPIAVA